mgnify:CR=1 FL=1
MTDHRWLTLARTIGSWPNSVGGYVVTREDKIVIGTGDFEKARAEWAHASVYFVPASARPCPLGEAFNDCARLIIPRGIVLLGVELDVEIEEIEL